MPDVFFYNYYVLSILDQFFFFLFPLLYDNTPPITTVVASVTLSDYCAIAGIPFTLSNIPPSSLSNEPENRKYNKKNASMTKSRDEMKEGAMERETVATERPLITELLSQRQTRSVADQSTSKRSVVLSLEVGGADEI